METKIDDLDLERIVDYAKSTCIFISKIILYCIILISILIGSILLFYAVVFLISWIVKAIVFLIAALLIIAIVLMLAILQAFILSAIIAYIFDEDWDKYIFELFIFSIILSAVIVYLKIDLDIKPFYDRINLTTDNYYINIEGTLQYIFIIFTKQIFSVPLYSILISVINILYFVVLTYFAATIIIYTRRINTIYGTGFYLYRDYVQSSKLGYSDPIEYYEGRDGGFDNYEVYKKGKELGFSTMLEMTNILELGFEDKNEYVKAINAGANNKSEYVYLLNSGYKNFDEMEEAMEKGFDNYEEYKKGKELGFSTMLEMTNILELGFKDKKEYVKAIITGANNKSEYVYLINSGYKNFDDMEEAMEKGFEDCHEFYDAMTLEIPDYTTYSDIIEDMRKYNFPTYDDYIYCINDIENHGFITYDEMKIANKLGFTYKDEMVDSFRKGFNTKFEEIACENLGFTTKKQWIIAIKNGFTDKKEVDAARKIGFSNGDEYRHAIRYKIPNYEIYKKVIDTLEEYRYDKYDSYLKYHNALIGGGFVDYNIFISALMKKIYFMDEWEDYITFRNLSTEQRKEIINIENGVLGIITKNKLYYPFAMCPHCEGKEKIQIFRTALIEKQICPNCKRRLTIVDLIIVDNNERIIKFYTGRKKTGDISNRKLSGTIALHMDCGTLDLDRVFNEYIHVNNCPGCDKKISKDDLKLFII